MEKKKRKAEGKKRRIEKIIKTKKWEPTTKKIRIDKQGKRLPGAKSAGVKNRKGTIIVLRIKGGQEINSKPEGVKL